MQTSDGVALVTASASGLGRATVEALLGKTVIHDLPSGQGETVRLDDAIRMAPR